MWFGLQFPDPGAHEKAVVHAYQPDHVFRVFTAAEDLPLILALLRDAATETGELEHPRCPACGEDLEVPPPEALEDPCASV
jgi:hypothetical protein